MSKSYKVIGQEVEGEIYVSEIRLLKARSIYLQIMLKLFNLLTFGIFQVLIKFSPNIKKKLFYSEVSHFKDATHVQAFSYGTYLSFSPLLISAPLKQFLTSGMLLYSFDAHNSQYYFECFKLKYFYDDQLEGFKVLHIPLEGIDISKLREQSGVSNTLFRYLSNLYGKNIIEVKIPGFLEFICNQFLFHPISILLYLSIIIWSIDSLFINITATLISTFITYSLLYCFVKKDNLELENNCTHSFSLQVLRDSHLQNTCSTELVPGDIVYINSNNLLSFAPFDCIVLEGTLLVDEANLNGNYLLLYQLQNNYFKGESIPIRKIGLPKNSSSTFKEEENLKHMLFDGSRILKIESIFVKVLIIRTGFYSIKGEITRSLLFKKKNTLAFYVEGIKLSIFSIILCEITYLSFYILSNLTSLFSTSLTFGLFCLKAIIYVASPGILIQVAQGTFFSLWRLKNKGIKCSDPSRLISAGSITTLCFDKTGTLTERDHSMEGYTFTQLQEEKKKKKLQIFAINSEPLDIQMSQESHLLKEKNQLSLIFKLMSCCHSTVVIDGIVKGDPLDIEMIKFSGWNTQFDEEKQIQCSSFNSLQLLTLKVNEFISELSSMSVIVLQEDVERQFSTTFEMRENYNTEDQICSQHAEKCAYIFKKGSLQSILKSLNHNESKDDLIRQERKLCSQGYRVIATGYKLIKIEELNQFLQLERDEQEHNLQFSGFLAFKTNLKSNTCQVIQDLKQSSISLRIISGDSELTTIRIAQECKLINFPKNSLYLLQGSYDNQSLNLVEIDSLGTQKIIVSSQSNEQLSCTCIQITQALMNSDKELCVTGIAIDIIHQMVNHISTIPLISQTKQLASDKALLSSFYQFILTKSILFSRTSSSQKSKIIQFLEQQGERVCMVGDGANDCKAIKQASVGISFSECEGGQSAPFISKQNDMSKPLISTLKCCVKQILLEGRMSMSCSYQIFKGNIQMGIIRFIGTLALNLLKSSFSDIQFVFQSSITGYSTVFTLIGINSPSNILEKSRFTGSLTSIYSYGSILIQFMIQSSAICLILSIYSNFNEEYQATQENSSEFFNDPNTILFYFSLIFAFYTHISTYIGRPVTKSIFNSWLLVIFLGLQFTYALLIIFLPETRIPYLHLTFLKDTYLIIWMLIISNFSGILQIILDSLLFKRYMNTLSQVKEHNSIQTIKDLFIRITTTQYQ